MIPRYFFMYFLRNNGWTRKSFHWTKFLNFSWYTSYCFILYFVIWRPRAPPYPYLSESYWLSGCSIRIDRGNYSCVAANSEGRSSSNLVEIKVKCKYFMIFFKERPMVNRYAFLNDEALRCFWIMYEYLFFPWNYMHISHHLSSLFLLS